MNLARLMLLDRNPWLRTYLAISVPIAIDELREASSPVAEADRLTRDHQMRAGVVMSTPDWDAWPGGDSTVPSGKGPLADGFVAVLATMSECLHHADDKKISKGRGGVVLAALARGLAVAALTTGYGVTIGGLHWCPGSCTACPDEATERPVWVGEDGLDGLAESMWAAAKRVADEAFKQRVAESEARFANA